MSLGRSAIGIFIYSNWSRGALRYMVLMLAPAKRASFLVLMTLFHRILEETIRPLCNAGWTVSFNLNKYGVLFNGSVILRGYKDAATDLWTLPINKCSKIWTTLSQSPPVLDCAPHPICPDLHPSFDLESFTHSVHMGVKGLSLHTSHCATQRFPHPKRQCGEVSSKDALIWPKHLSSSTSMWVRHVESHFKVRKDNINSVVVEYPDGGFMR